MSLLMLLAVAAAPLGLNKNTTSPARVRVLLLILVLMIAVVAGIFEFLLRRWRLRVGEPPRNSMLTERGLSLPNWFWCGSALVSALWGGACLVLFANPHHLDALAIAVGLAVFLYASRTLIWTPIRLQMLPATPRQVALAVWAAVALALAAYWFVSNGIWQGKQPLSGGWLAGSAVLFFLGTVVVYASAGLTLASGLPERRRPSQYVLSRDEVRGYILLDAMNLGAVFLIGIDLPLYAATRDTALHGSALNVIASLVFLPGLLAAVFWGLSNWRAWEDLNEQASQAGVAVPIFELADEDWAQAQTLDARRAARFRHHIRLNRYSVLALLGLGLGYLVDVLLR